MTSHPITLGQQVLLVSLTSRRTFFGCLRSVIRLEKSYVVVSVSPVEEAYGSFVPVQYQLLSSTLSDHIHDEFETRPPALMGEDGPSSSSNPPEH
ncbi:hypothetical protein PISMIDRAFT_18763 [Pisolithus microcarpus 441]|uniref:Uncharacterized protein n=1 Tax=Pisolithus microcarpus 441 TaxID=765257 RepID=A0A0C9YPW3_9AGAM|nr:hypothetical protein PISMIDRAFT_18763 [Pisolithus microcarpus 441]